MRKVTGIAAAVVVAVLAYGAVGPFLAIHGIQKALNDKDPEGLRDRVDFPALRESLKGQISADMARRVHDSEGEMGGFAAMAAGIGFMMVDKIVDQLVTPEGITTMLTKGVARESSSNGADDSSGEKIRIIDRPNTDWGFVSPSRFDVTLTNDEGEKVDLILRRQLLTWRLTSIQLPSNLGGG